jgi:hypothetical protein
VGQTASAKADPSAPLQKETVETDGQILVDAVLGRFARRTLPMVEAPKVDGSAGVMPQAVEALAQMSNEMASEEAGKPVGAAAPRPSRYALLAAGLALAAVLGSFVGSLSTVGFVQLWPEAPAKSAMTDAGALQALKAELAALKASLDVATRNDNSQLAKIADRLERVERAGNEPAAKLTRIAQAVDRLEKKSGAAATALGATGAISANTENAGPPEPKVNDRILDGWVVRDVRHGRALLESRNGGVFVVGPGALLPGLGHVEAIKRQDGEWVVVTTRGLIASGP